MRKVPRLLYPVLLIIAVAAGCSKKSHPSRSQPAPVTKTAPQAEKLKESDFPKVISVNDSAARKSVDGRMYYDVMGHRYWKNYKDGKYYLFNKSMYNNPDFKPRSK